MRRFVVFNSKGGVGKTTLACGLAAAFARHGYRAVVCDADPQGSLTSWFSLQGRRGLAETPVGTLNPRFAAISIRDGLHVVPTGDPVMLDLIARRTASEIPPYAKEIPADMMIVDTAAGASGLSEAFLRAGRPEIIVPVSVDGGYLPLAALGRTWQAVEDTLGREPDYVVPTMYDRRTSSSDRAVADLRTECAHILAPPIRTNATLAQASWGREIPADPKSLDDFGRLAELIYARWGGSVPEHSVPERPGLSVPVDVR